MTNIFGYPVIDRFSGQYEFLSNFYRHQVVYLGIVWPTSEHAYQAMKCLCDDESLKFHDRNMTPGQAKRLGQKVAIRPDWEEVKLKVMEEIVTAKFSDPDLAEMLLLTEDAILIEGNTWGDRFWGMCNGVGKNYLGLILMHVRGTLQ